ncbi:MAG: indole-3-glycerol phosphate synthase TrpC [Alphaproteobacteria bacterium]|tara:strand:+ start:9733 stop:10500 length:768 start_codon:yes stop_codon:yes gene_type:complete
MDILEKICLLKMKEIEILKRNDTKIKRKSKIRNFFKDLKKKNYKTFNLITEIKRASPSKGIIREDFNPKFIAQQYEKAGAKCISVLTEKNFFEGSLKILKEVKNSVNIPILRKDFIIDEWQIYESFNNEADCILLIVAALDDYKLKTFYKIAKKLGLSVITEVHDENELYKALKLNVECIGINNRNLKTLKVDLNTFKKLSPKIPDNIIKICESGISSNKEIKEYSNLGADAFLIGESLMKSNNIYKETRYLINK